MNKIVVLIVGVLVAAGTVAAMSAPSFHGQRLGGLFDDLLDGIGRTGERISQRFNAEGMDGASAREERKGRRNRAYARSDDSREVGIDADDGEPSLPRGRFMRRSAEQEQGAEDRKESRRRGSHAMAGMERRTDQLFRALDKNGDGVIDAAEFAAAFKRLDADGDGKVTREEFGRFAKERSAKLDLDDDSGNADVRSQPERRASGPSK